MGEQHRNRTGHLPNVKSVSKLYLSHGLKNVLRLNEYPLGRNITMKSIESEVWHAIMAEEKHLVKYNNVTGKIIFVPALICWNQVYNRT